MWKRYGLIGLMKITLSYIYTKIFYNRSRLIRFPFDIRNRSNIDLGYGLTTGVGCRIEAFPQTNEIVIKFGKNVQINDYVHITGMNKVHIGDNVLMASKIYISDCTHGSYQGNDQDSSPNTPPALRKYSISSVIIEDNVWIGESVSILPGVTIGRCSIIGANSVVTKNIPAYSIVVGIPAKAIKQFNHNTNKWEVLK